MPGVNVPGVNGQSPRVRAPTAVDSTAIGFGRHRPPPLAITPRRRISDEVLAATHDEDGSEPRSRWTLLLIDDVRLRRECLFHLLSAELPDFDVRAVATTQSPETWAASPDLVLASAPGSDAGGGLPVSDIVALANGAPVLLLTESESDNDALGADEPGVAGRFPTACGTTLLIAAIQLVLAGGRFQIPIRPNGKTTAHPSWGATG